MRERQTQMQSQVPPDDEAFSAAEVKARAATGAALQMGRGMGIQTLGFLANLVLARLLVPEDFGLVAIGLTILNVGQVLAGTGLGSAFVAKEEPPTRTELRALTGLQLLATGTIAAGALAIAVSLGDDALITGVMVVALPLTAFRTGAIIHFLRRLDFLSQVKIEIGETLVYVVVALALAFAGFGAWSLAIATVARILSGTTIAVALSPLGFIVPSFRFGLLRPILGFGWRFQATGVVQLGRETALTAGIASVGSLSLLGMWSLGARILGIPRLVTDAMWRVGFPAFSRLGQTESGEDMSRLLERTVAAFATVVTLVVCPLMASSPALIPLLFGAKWSDVSVILIGGAVALCLAAPVGMVANSYLYARGDAATSLYASVVTGAVDVAVILALLPSMGATALAIGPALGAVCGSTLVLLRTRRVSDARLAHLVAGPFVSAAIGATAGYVIADSLGPTLPSAAASAATGLALWLILMRLVAPRTQAEGLATTKNIASVIVARTRASWAAWRKPAVAASPASGVGG
jgi:O-antigen/teichoic acid export membrane protein